MNSKFYKIFRLISFWGLTIGLPISCTPDSFFEQEIILDSARWPYDNPIRFTWQINDTANTYDLQLQVDHLREMDFRNCYVKIITEFPDASLTNQILSMELYDSSGKAYGKCDSKNCTTILDLMGQFKFPMTGTYSLIVEQFGRDSILNGLNALRLKLNQAKN